MLDFLCPHSNHPDFLIRFQYLVSIFHMFIVVYVDLCCLLHCGSHKLSLPYVTVQCQQFIQYFNIFNGEHGEQWSSTINLLQYVWNVCTMWSICLSKADVYVQYVHLCAQPQLAWAVLSWVGVFMNASLNQINKSSGFSWNIQTYHVGYIVGDMMI